MAVVYGRVGAYDARPEGAFDAGCAGGVAAVGAGAGVDGGVALEVWKAGFVLATGFFCGGGFGWMIGGNEQMLNEEQPARLLHMLAHVAGL